MRRGPVSVNLDDGFGRFRIDAALPGVTREVGTSSPLTPVADGAAEAIAKTTRRWFGQHDSLSKPDNKDESGQRPPSLSQWFDLVGELEADDQSALTRRLNPTTAGGKSWKHVGAKAIRDKLNDGALQPKQRALHARLFVRCLRAELLNAVGSQQEPEQCGEGHGGDCRSD